MNFYLEFCIYRSTFNENLNTNNLLSICTKKIVLKMIKNEIYSEEISFCENDLTEELFNAYKSSKYLAVDTEAMGLCHGRDRLCLIQICNESNVTSCIKIQIGSRKAPRIQNLLEDKTIMKILKLENIPY